MSNDKLLSGIDMMISNLDKDDLNDCASLYVTVFNAEPWNENLDKAMALQRLSHLISLPNMVGRKCIVENNIVGFWIGYIEPLADFNRLFIKEILVHSKLQNQGVGKHLMQSVDEYEALYKCRNICLLTNRETNAYFFYQKMGYDSPQDIIFMEKSVKSQSAS